VKVPPEVVTTTVVGSYPQPPWLIHRELLAKGVPRVRARELWALPDDLLERAQDDAAELAIRDMERAGIDVITDGEVRRESYSNHFVAALEGIDAVHPGSVTNRAGRATPVPRIVGAIRRTRAIEVDALSFLRRMTDRPVKVTLPGPFTLSQQARDEWYQDPETVAMAFAAAVNEEAGELQAAGADVIQLDEPWLRNDPVAAERYAVGAINRALEGITATTAVHLCFGYAAVVGGEKPTGYSFLPQLAECSAEQISIEAAQPKLDLGVLDDLSGKVIVLGVIDLHDPDVEPVDVVEARIRRGLEHLAPTHLVAAPDCGMKYLPRATAFNKLRTLADAARSVRAELGRDEAR
jgi:5-methyltetrahydropteroyltriglutamate--homocysteine methyltransferase